MRAGSDARISKRHYRRIVISEHAIVERAVSDSIPRETRKTGTHNMPNKQKRAEACEALPMQIRSLPDRQFGNIAARIRVGRSPVE
jgi:hypothetical protein